MDFNFINCFFSVILAKHYNSGPLQTQLNLYIFLYSFSPLRNLVFIESEWCTNYMDVVIVFVFVGADMGKPLFYHLDLITMLSSRIVIFCDLLLSWLR